jgi:hypothetical protein
MRSCSWKTVVKLSLSPFISASAQHDLDSNIWSRAVSFTDTRVRDWSSTGHDPTCVPKTLRYIQVTKSQYFYNVVRHCGEYCQSADAIIPTSRLGENVTSQYSIASSNKPDNCSLSASPPEVSKLGANCSTLACGIVPSTSISTCEFLKPSAFRPLG